MDFRILGPIEVRREGRPVPISGTKQRSLLALFLLHVNQALSPERLIDALWGGRPPATASKSLQMHVSRLRRALTAGAGAEAGQVPETCPAGYRISLRPADLDLGRFEAGVAEGRRLLGAGHAEDACGRFRSALAEWRGPPLADIALEPFAQLEIARLEERRLAAMEDCIDAELARGRHAESVAEIERLVAEHPYRERLRGQLMLALYQSGRQAEALRAYSDTRRTLVDELGIEPSRELRALEAAMLAQDEALGPPPRSLSADRAGMGRAGEPLPLPPPLARSERRPFVGRRDELERLRELWSEVGHGEGVVVLLSGEPGIGKTRLAARFAAEAHAGGTTVLYGRSDEDTVVPYEPFVEALHHFVQHEDRSAIEAALGPQFGELCAMLPELGPAASASGETHRLDPENRRFLLFDAVLAVIAHAARRQPLLLIVEDLHWADASTVLLLRRIVRDTAGSTRMILATYRDVEVDANAPLARALADLLRERFPQRLRLTGLDESDTAELLVQRHRPDLRGAFAQRLCDYTAGNPFFIEETLSDAREAVVRGHAGEPAALLVSENVETVIMRRLHRLGRITLEVLTAASVLGREFSLITVEGMLDRDAQEILGALEDAARTGLVVEDRERITRFAFRHALVRETLYESLSPTRRERLHLRAAETLSELGGSVPVHAGDLAQHFFLSRHVGGAERAIGFAVDAARAATRTHGYEEAAAHCERALEVLDLLPASADQEEQRIEILLELGAARWQGGEPGARQAFYEAAEFARRRHAPILLVRAALGAGGRFYAPGTPDVRYVRLLEEALRLVGAADRALRARLLARLAETLSGDPRDNRPEALSLEALDIARRAADDRVVIAALLARHAALLHVGNLPERLVLAEEALHMAQGLDALELAALTRHWLVYDLVESGDISAARARHDELDRDANALRQPLYRHSALAWRGVWAQLDGRFDVAEDLAREGLKLAQRASAPDADAHFTAQLVAVRHGQGRLPELLHDIERLASDHPAAFPWGAALALAYVAHGERSRAERAFRAAVETAAERPRTMLWLTEAAMLAEAASALEDAACAPALFRRLEPHASRLVQSGFAGCWGSVHLHLGLLAAIMGRREVALGHLDAALGCHMRIGAAPLAVRTKHERVAVLRRPAVVRARPPGTGGTRGTSADREKQGL